MLSDRAAGRAQAKGRPDGRLPPPSEAKLVCACGVLGILTHSPTSGEVNWRACWWPWLWPGWGGARAAWASEPTERCSTPPGPRECESNLQRDPTLLTGTAATNTQK